MVVRRAGSRWFPCGCVMPTVSSPGVAARGLGPSVWRRSADPWRWGMLSSRKAASAAITLAENVVGAPLPVS